MRVSYDNSSALVNTESVAAWNGRLPYARLMRYKFIRDRLDELKKTPADMARALDLPTSRIAEMWSGKRAIHADELAPLADFLEWRVERLARQLAEASAIKRLEARIAKDQANLEAMRQRGKAQPTGPPLRKPQRRGAG